MVKTMNAEQKNLKNTLPFEDSQQNKFPKISPALRDENTPLSFTQHRLWFLAQLSEKMSSAYHLSMALELNGQLDKDALKQALDYIVNRHESLRTTFITVNNKPVQQISNNGEFALKTTDLTHNLDKNTQLKQIRQQHSCTPFDLQHGPLIRGQLIKLEPQQHILLITMHHIISDACSIHVLESEIGQLYSAYYNNTNISLPILSIQYADHAIWQQQWTNSETWQQQAQYWQQTLQGIPQLLHLPCDHTRPAEQNFHAERITFTLDNQLTQDLYTLCQKYQSSEFIVLLASWSVLMHRLSGQDDIVIGTYNNNRNHQQLQELIGCLVNNIALRVNLSKAPTFTKLLEQLKQTVQNAEQHQNFPFEQIIELLQCEPNLSYNPIFQVMFTWHNNLHNQQQLDDLKLVPLANNQHIATVDLSINLWNTGDTIEGWLEYSTALFKPQTIERYLSYWLQLLTAIIQDKQQNIEQLPILSQQQSQQLIRQWNNTNINYEQQQCFHELIEVQVTKTPEAIAIVQDDIRITYLQLNRRANRFAHLLLSLEIKPNDIIAICVKPGPEMVIAIVAILKAGAAYVLLDPTSSIKQLAYTIQDSHPKALLLEPQTKPLFDQQQLPSLRSIPQIDLKAEYTIWTNMPTTNLDRTQTNLTAKHLAYIVYTAKTTDEPKGVQVEHRNVVNHIHSMKRLFRVKPNDRFIQLSSPNTNIFVAEIASSLTHGASLYIPTSDQTMVGSSLEKYCSIHQITHAYITPTLLNTLTCQASLKSIQTLLATGEKLDAQTAQYWSQGRDFYNVYGPAETTIFATAYQCKPSPNDPPIGRPLANIKAYILDHYQRPVPQGVIGELYIGGAGVTRGYINQQQLTKERFLPDPFALTIQAKMYKTGDLVRWCSDGNIEYLSHNDFQLKRQGYCLELNEIEKCLCTHPAIKSATIQLREDEPGNTHIVAYYIIDKSAINQNETPPKPAKLRQYVLSQLPEFLVPAAYVAIDSIPLTANGKIDHHSLKPPQYQCYAQAIFEAPEGEIEGLLTQIWQDVLGRERVGRHDNFFEIGGGSLNILELNKRLRSSGIDLEPTDFFKNPTIATAAAHIVKIKDQDPHNGPVLLKSGKAPALFIVHDGSGLLAYAHLLTEQLNIDNAIYGLPAPKLTEPQPPTLKAMATRVKAQVQTVQANGPYYLAGWSFGGLLAFELATQLIEAQQPVQFLSMFDTQAPQAKNPQTDNATKTLIQCEKTHLISLLQVEAFGNEDLQSALQTLLRASEILTLQQVIEHANALKQNLMPAHLSNLPSEQVSEYLQQQQSFHLAALEYFPAVKLIPEIKSIHLFEAEATQTSVKWIKLTKGRVNTINASGSHYSMMTSPHIEQLAKTFEQIFKQSEQINGHNSR